MLLLVVIVLWASCVGQNDGTLLLWAREHVRRVLLGHEVPASACAPWPQGVSHDIGAFEAPAAQ